MKKEHTLHLGWALVASIAFFLGSQLHKTSDATEASGKSTRLSIRSANPASESSQNRTTASSKHSSRKSILIRTRQLSEADIAELGLELRNSTNPVTRRIAFAEILKNLTVENAQLMREQIAHLAHNTPEFREFHYAWGVLAGEEAVLSGFDPEKRDMASALAGWASVNPTAAMAYFDNLTSEQQNGSSHMKWGVAYGLANADPQLAAEFAIERYRNGDRDADKIIHIAAGSALQTGDLQVATRLAQSIPEGHLQDHTYHLIGKEMVKENPVKAIQWAASLPAGEGKQLAIGSSFHHWAASNPVAAADALSSVSPGERDSATYGYATRVVHVDPAAGVEWAAEIRDQTTRASALIDTGRIYYRRDPQAAAIWLANSGLTSEQQQKITGGE